MCQLMVTNCICEPACETSWPNHNKRKSRYCNATSGEERCTAVVVAVGGMLNLPAAPAAKTLRRYDARPVARQ